MEAIIKKGGLKVDGSTLFSNNNTSAAGGAPADGTVPVGGDSAVINADDLLGTTDDGGAATVTPDPAAADPSVSLGQIGDPLAGTDDVADTTTTEEDDIVPNDTITTNDWSKVGDVKQEEEPAPELPNLLIGSEPEEEPAPEIVEEPAPVPFASELKFKLPGIDDPEKIAFIKTYTQEFDDALKWRELELHEQFREPLRISRPCRLLVFSLGILQPLLALLYLVSVHGQLYQWHPKSSEPNQLRA